MAHEPSTANGRLDSRAPRPARPAPCAPRPARQPRPSWRRATADMDKRFPDVTIDELRAQNADDICIICREEMELAKRLPCGHCLHKDVSSAAQVCGQQL